jgi:hypothetical protein
METYGFGYNSNHYSLSQGKPNFYRSIAMYVCTSKRRASYSLHTTMPSKTGTVLRFLIS